MKSNLPDREDVKKNYEKPPQWFVDLIADAMIEWGPDGHCDGHEDIAALAWVKAREALGNSEYMRDEV
jgi:hypothetical protein